MTSLRESNGKLLISFPHLLTGCSQRKKVVWNSGNQERNESSGLDPCHAKDAKKGDWFGFVSFAASRDTFRFEHLGFGFIPPSAPAPRLPRAAPWR